MPPHTFITTWRAAMRFSIGSKPVHRKDNMGVRGAERMKPGAIRTRGIRIGVIAVGIGLLAIAWSVRQYALRPQPVRAGVVTDADNAAHTAKMQAEVESLEQRISATPSDIPKRQALLLLYQKMGKPDRATDQLAAIVELRPGDQTAALALANAR